jgi:O-antigen ligase
VLQPVPPSAPLTPLWAALRDTPPWAIGLSLIVGAGLWFLPPFVVPALLVGLIAFGLLLRRPVLGLYAVVLSVPMQKVVTLGSLTVTQLLMGVVLAAWIVGTLVERRRVRVPPVALALGLYLTAMWASLLVAQSLNDGLGEIARWGVVLAAYLLAVNLVHTRWEVAGLIGSFLVGAGGEAAVGLVQSVLGLGPESFQIGENTLRSYGTIGMPNSFAGYLDLTLPLALALTLWALFRAGGALRRARTLAATASDAATAATAHAARRAVWPPLALAAGLLAATGLIGAGVLSSLSRGAWLGLAFGLLVMILALGRQGLPALILGIVGAILVLVLGAYGALPSTLTGRLGSIVEQFQIFDVRGAVLTPDNFAQVERLAHWQTAGNMALSDPWLGIGVGNFNARFADFYVEPWPHSQGHAHNYYLQALAETGGIGLAAYLLLLLVALGSGFRAVRRVTGVDRALIIGGLGVLATLMLHNFFENLHVLNLGIHWAAVLALFAIVPRLSIADRGVRIAESPAHNPQSAIYNPQSAGGLG